MRDEVLREVWEAQDEAYILMCEYDALPHCYGEDTLYQSEGHIIDLIAAQPGITATDLAGILNKTVSACSQMIRKLRAKGWVKADKKPALNPDLWGRLLDLCEKHTVNLHWVKGHAENEFNNRCDEMAVAESRKAKGL